MSKFKIEESSLTPFLKKLCLFCGGGPFLDGYILVIIGAALVQLGPKLQLDAYWTGLLGAASLIGLFLGSLVFGYLTDLIGRRLMYILDLIALVLLSILQMFITTSLELAILRFVLGAAIGANYPIATSLLAEFAPTKYRHFMLGSLTIWWFVGAVAANLVGYALIDVPDGWQWMLGISAVPAILLIFGNLPESPRWLLSKNRIEEARNTLKKCYGPDADIDAIDQTVVVSAGLSKLFEPMYLKRIVLVGGFWTCSVLPLFAIYTFGPTILQMFGLSHGKEAMLGDIVISMLFVIGMLPALVWVNTIGRRPLIIWSFGFMTIGMLILALFPNGSSWIIMTGFAIYALASGGPNIMQWLYSNELFPTEVRASAVGIGTAISRIGACLGTYLLPIWLQDYGLGTTMFIMAGVTFVGLVICMALAPETKGLTLEQAAGSADSTPESSGIPM